MSLADHAGVAEKVNVKVKVLWFNPKKRSLAFLGAFVALRDADCDFDFQRTTQPHLQSHSHTEAQSHKG